MLWKYQHLYRKLPVYLPAIALDPKKFDYFRTGAQLGEWTHEDGNAAMASVRQLWVQQYKNQPSRPGSGVQRPNLDVEGEYTMWRRARYGIHIGMRIRWPSLWPYGNEQVLVEYTEDEFERYISSPPGEKRRMKSEMGME